MKIHALSLMLLAATPAFAGSGKEVAPAPAPAPVSDSCNWFIGGTAGYLTELEEDYYTLHLGRDTDWQLLGWDTAWYVEVGYAETSERERFFDPQEDEFFSTHAELDIIPVTFNLKFERPISGALSFYWGLGAGVAFTDLKLRTESVFGTDKHSDDDTVFVAQGFAGLLYNLSETTEIYGGARYIYLDDPDFGDAELDLGDDCYIEAGIRFNF